MKRLLAVSTLATLYARLDQAVTSLDHVVTEGGRPHCDWKHMAARMAELERRIGGLCDDAQVALFERRGFYDVPTKKGAA